MPHNKIQHSKISRFKNNEIETVDDLVAVELPLEIRLGYADQFTTLVITMCSPADIEDLIYGYLYSDGIIDNINQIENIEVFDVDFGVVAEVRCSKDVEIDKNLSKGKVYRIAVVEFVARQKLMQSSLKIILKSLNNLYCHQTKFSHSLNK